MLMYFLFTLLLVGYFVYKTRTKQKIDRFFSFKLLYAVTVLATATAIVALIYIAGSLLGYVVFRTSDAGVLQTIWDAIQTIIGILLFWLFLVPGPGIVLCAVWTHYKENLIKKSIVGLIIFSLSITGIAVLNRRWLELHLATLLISSAAVIQAAMSAFWFILSFLKYQDEELSQTGSNVSLIEDVKSTITGIKNHNEIAVGIVRNIVHADQLIAKIKHTHLLLLQLCTLAIALVSSLFHRTVNLEQVAFANRNYVLGVSWIAGIIPALVVLLWLFRPHKAKLFVLIKIFIIFEIAFGIASICTWSSSAYIRLFGAFSWIYTIIATISCWVNYVLCKEDIENDEILLKKFAEQIESRMTTNSTVQNMGIKAKHAQKTLATVKDSIKKIELVLSRRRKLRDLQR